MKHDERVSLVLTVTTELSVGLVGMPQALRLGLQCDAEPPQLVEEPRRRVHVHTETSTN